MGVFFFFFFFNCYGPYEVARCKILALHLRASMQVPSKADICLFSVSLCWSYLGAANKPFLIQHQRDCARHNLLQDKVTLTQCYVRIKLWK